MANADLNVDGEDRGHELVEATSDVPQQPAFTARLAFLHGNIEHDSDPAVSFDELGPPDRSSLPLVAPLTPQQPS